MSTELIQREVIGKEGQCIHETLVSDRWDTCSLSNGRQKKVGTDCNDETHPSKLHNKWVIINEIFEKKQVEESVVQSVIEECPSTTMECDRRLYAKNLR